MASSTERFAGTFWTLVGAVVVLIVALIGLAVSQTGVGPKTASNQPTTSAPATSPAIKPQPTPLTATP